uniref:Uncharacterized protein n=1 Tax=Rhizophora mucronata TaxID=61149 RepID=A0A2P2PIU5_RHIMU
MDYEDLVQAVNISRDCRIQENVFSRVQQRDPEQYLCCCLHRKKENFIGLNRGLHYSKDPSRGKQSSTLKDHFQKKKKDVKLINMILYQLPSSVT